MLSIGDLMTAISKGRDVAKAAALPKFELAEYGGVLPEAIALPMSAEALGDASNPRALDDLRGSADNARCHELRLRMQVRNGSTRPLEIIGIYPRKAVLDREYGSAIMFPPQGSIGGDVVRFECDLDKDGPSMRRFELDGIQRRYTSGEYYFAEGALEVEPGRLACISVLFRAENRVYEVSPEIIVRVNGGVKEVPVPTRERGIVCPAAMIPDEAKMIWMLRDAPPLLDNDPARFNALLRY